jgi:hypothetical protein
MLKNELLQKLEIDKERVVFDISELETLLVKAYRLGFGDGFDFYKVRAESYREEADKTIQYHFDSTISYNEE